MKNDLELLPITFSLRGTPALSLSKGAKSSRTRRQGQNCRRRSQSYIEDDFDPTTIGSLQPAVVEPVVGIRSKICKTNPIYSVFRPKTMIMIKNEPNSNPIPTNRLLSWPAVRFLSTYSGQTLRKKCCASSSLRPKQQNFSGPRATLKKMRNEPNFKNTKMNITPVKTKNYEKNRAFARRQNEPKTNPISNFPLGFNQFIKKCKTNPIFKTLK